jgi:hypothetical protein
MSFTNAVSILFTSTLLFLVSCSEEPPPKDTNNSSINIVAEAPKSTSGKRPQLPENTTVATIETQQVQSLQLGEKFVFREKDQQPIRITINEHRTDANGTRFLSGMEKGAKGTYQLTVTAGDSVTYGRIQTPSTTYTFTVEAGKTTVIDLKGPGNAVVPKNPNDAKLPQRQKENNIGNIDSIPPDTLSTENSIPNITGKTTIDLMIVYSNGFAAEHPDDALLTRLNHLVSVSNTLYSNSNINIYLRLVHTAEVSYPDNTTNDSALDDLTDGNGVFSTVESLRQLHGADLVTFLRPYDASNHAGCGIAWLLGTNSYGFTYDSGHAYSVVSDGSEQVGNTTYYCSEQSLAHELGHNMGSAHDRAHASSSGAYSYSYGYGINGKFGTVMSYINPEIDYFSNPDIICNAGPPAEFCGIDEAQPSSANNTLSLNNAAASIAGFVAAKYSADIDGDGNTDSTDTIKALTILTGNSASGNVDPIQDVSGDNKLGLAEAINSLQQSKN